MRGPAAGGTMRWSAPSTPARAMTPSLPSRPRARPEGPMRERAWGLASAVAVLVGSVGPWATFGPFTKNGLSGDGAITLALGLLVLVAVVVRRAPLGVLVAGAFVALIGIVDTVDVTAADQLLAPSPGWGVLLTAAAGLSVVAWAVVQLARRRRIPAVAAAPRVV